jgi:hypothetical protein
MCHVSCAVSHAPCVMHHVRPTLDVRASVEGVYALSFHCSVGGGGGSSHTQSDSAQGWGDTSPGGWRGHVAGRVEGTRRREGGDITRGIHASDTLRSEEQERFQGE